jgi:ferredoxin-NADP reductase
MAMVRSLVDFRYEGKITFLHYSHSPEHTIFREELEQLAALENIDLHVVHTRAGGQRFNELQLRRLAPAYARTATFACGPAGLIEPVQEVYGDSDNLKLEYFKTSTLPTNPDDATGRVSYTRTGASAENTGATLLEQAEALGMRPEYGCRMGICHTCTSRKTEGTVRNVLSGETYSQPDEDIQICITAPVGDCAVDI